MLTKTTKRAPARANKKPPVGEAGRAAILASAHKKPPPLAIVDDRPAGDFDPYAAIAAGYVREYPTPSKPEKYDRLLDSKIGAERKKFPVTTGFLDYFPDAVAAAAEVSFLGNQKHNPGQPLHHSRGKSSDHADCIGRHLIQRGGFEDITIDGVVYKVRHSAALLWRAAALLQEELETDKGYALPRGASVKD